MSNHPDRIFATLIVQGVKEGFRIGFDYNHFLRVKSCNRNMASVYDHPSVVHEYLANECAHGRVFGPFDSLPVPSLRLSKFGVIPKRNQENKWRLIVDLSSPTDQSINDGIDADNCSMSYVTVDDIAASVLALGRGALLAKSDIKHAYRQIPVHPQDRILLGLQWQGQFYVDATLPFGLRSAPLIFSAVADAVEWVMRTSGVKHISTTLMTLIVIVGPPNSDDCSFGLRSFRQTCENLGLLVAEDKTEGPAKCLTVLGIEFDTEAMVLRLPVDKLERVQSLLQFWKGKGSVQRRDLESFASTCMQSGAPRAHFYASHLRSPGANPQLQETLSSAAK